jgi:hypothetical protein
MVGAVDYPLLNLFWTMILLFLWIAWIWVLIVVIRDVFRRNISGWAKAAWMFFMIFLPFLGVFVYIIANGSGMTQRDVQELQAQQQQFDAYVRDVAGGPASELQKAKQLLDSGAINQQEYEALKAKALAA